MFNWGYENVARIEEAASLPKQICVKVWVKDLSTGGANQLQFPCLDMPLTTIDTTTGDTSMKTAFNAFSSSATSITAQPSTASTLATRTNLHVVFTVAPADPTHQLESGGMYSFD